MIRTDLPTSNPKWDANHYAIGHLQICGVLISI